MRLMKVEIELIAPCGMNCGVCHRYLKENDPCPGCRGDDALKLVSCTHCVIKNCGYLAASKSGFCFECPSYPCRRLKALDKRYRTKYGMSMMENLQTIETKGLEPFAADENERWSCKICGGTICVHKGYCVRCRTVRPGF